jgi:hypothetical protein
MLNGAYNYMDLAPKGRVIRTLTNGLKIPTGGGEDEDS